MKTRSRIICAAALLWILCATGCYESEFPLDPAPQAALDDSLLANWRCLVAAPVPDESAFTLAIGTVRTGVYAVTLLAEDEKPETYEAHASVIDEASILNIKESGSESWVFGRYQFLLPNVLQIQIVDGAAMEGKYDTPASLRQAIAQRLNNPRLFSDLCTCVRVNKS